MSHSLGNEPPLAAVVHDGRIACSLEEAALVLARQEYPTLDPAPWLARIDAMAALVQPLLSQQPDAAETIGAVSDVLFRNLLFHGNTENYGDARNSFLNDVLERRTGIPITLAVVYMAVARRVGLTLLGTNFPGHFLMLYPRRKWPIVVDAFDGGRVLSSEECERLAARAGIAGYRQPPQPVADIAILRRMLENLKNIYTAAHDWQRLQRTSAQILAVTPDDVEQHRVQGIAAIGLGDAAGAIAALEHYLRVRPLADDRETVRDLVRRLRAGRAGTDDDAP